MADNNKNPRRTIWLSETEPLSHYDIWLSKNQHLSSDGDLISDSGVLRDCDYIFKVWDCNNWHPIVGLNSTALNKINTVLNTGYTTTHDGHNINSSSYLEFHLPLFTSPNSSPLELFDAGTIGDAILEYVTGEEWKKIFEGDAFSYAFKWYIEEGDTNINLAINPAEADKLGGIYADEFQEEDIFFEDFNNHYISLINHANDSWLALAKYKLGYNTSRPEDYNLYISAKDIIRIVKQYQHDNPDEPGITPGGGAIISPEVLYNSFLDSESIKRDWNDVPVLDASKPHFSLWGACGTLLTDNAGKYLKIRDDAAEWRVNPGPYSDTNNALEWQSAHDIVTEGTGYTTDSIKKYLSCQNGEFDWESNVGTEYFANYPIGINSLTNEISILPQQGDTSELYLCSKNNSVSWQPIDTGLTYDVLSELNHLSTGEYVIKGCGNETSPAKFFLNGNGEWTEQIEGNGFNTFVFDNKIYIGPYYCNIPASDFTLDKDILINVDGTYSNNRYPLESFVNYLVQCLNGVSRIKIESERQVDLPYPSYMNFETSTKCTFTFPKSMEFIETVSVNSSNHENCYYTDTDYIIELKPATKYNVTFYKSCIKFETNSNSIFNQQLPNEA